MRVLLLAVFIVSSAIHLYASAKRNSRLRAYTKPFILLGLLGWYCLSAEPILWVAVAAVFLSWLGDVLLIPPGTGWFTAGGISFMISHLCFAAVYCRNIDFRYVPFWLIVLVALIYGIAVFVVLRGLKKYLPKRLFWPMTGYLCINGVNNCCALYQLFCKPCLASAVIYLGAVLFFASDSILFYVRFNKQTRWKSHFPVMLTYIIAEFLIVYGIMMMG